MFQKRSYRKFSSLIPSLHTAFSMSSGRLVQEISMRGSWSIWKLHTSGWCHLHNTDLQSDWSGIGSTLRELSISKGSANASYANRKVHTSIQPIGRTRVDVPLTTIQYEYPKLGFVRKKVYFLQRLLSAHAMELQQQVAKQRVGSTLMWKLRQHRHDIHTWSLHLSPGLS